MATIVSSEITKGFEPLFNAYGGSTPVIELIAAGAIPTVGTVLKMDGAGRVDLAGAAATLTIVGVAASTAAAAGDKINVWPAWPGMVFTAQFEDQANGGTAGASTGTAHVLAAADGLESFAIHVDPAGSKFHYIDENVPDTTAKVVITLGPAPGHAIGDTLTRLRCIFLHAATIWGGGTVAVDGI